MDEKDGLMHIKQAIEIFEKSKYDNFLVFASILAALMGMMYADEHSEMMDIRDYVIKKVIYLLAKLEVERGDS